MYGRMLHPADPHIPPQGMGKALMVVKGPVVKGKVGEAHPPLVVPFAYIV